MNVIAKISCYFERSVVTLKLCKEYLNTVTYNIPVLLRIKYWTVWCIEHYSMSTYTGVSNFQKTVRFFGPPCIYTRKLSNHKHIQTAPNCRNSNIASARIYSKNRKDIGLRATAVPPSQTLAPSGLSLTRLTELDCIGHNRAYST